MRRTEAHRIDTRGQALLEQALPADFVARRLFPDYGIDYQVEIFDGDTPTGLQFYIQLKSMAKAGSPAKVSLKLDHLAYWRSLPLPVLVVVADVGAGAIWCTWANDLDSFAARSEQRAMTFRLALTDEWSAAASQQIRSDVEAIRRFRERAVEWPIGIAVVGGDGVGAGVNPDSVRDAIRPVLEKYQQIAVLRPAGTVESSDLRIVCCDTSIRFATLSAPHLVVDHDEGAPSPSGSDLLVLCGLALFLAQQLKQAARLVGDEVSDTSLWRNSALSRLMAIALVAGGEAGKALECGSRLVAAGDEVEHSAEAVLAAVCASSGDSTLDPEALERVMEDRYKALAGRRPQAAGHAAYNLGNFYRCTSRPEDAELWLERAAAAWPEYRRLGYWHRELGGAQFLKERYGAAAASYARAIDLGDDYLELPLLHGDALFRSGRFLDAVEALVPAAELPGHAGAFARLIAIACRLIIDVTEQIAQVYPRAERSAPETRDEAEAMVQEWALNAKCWIMLGDDPEDPRYLVTAAVVALYLPELWASALLGALAVGDEELAEDCATTARYYVGHPVLDACDDVAHAVGMSELLGRAVDLYDAAAPLPAEPFTTRVFLQDGERETP